ncbi:hypothetical protein Tsubulata_046786 [Turnera subulata]|uniref:Protein kinase domain-containing protein n=1 Tax=Turnera subulata TaxID=218843 RepID=A0A9Q0JCD7_9ROSI|nr:hypothetical protein Tsubulata_046786 [Turnera subulata]
MRPNGKQVTVKVWEDEKSLYEVLPGDNEIRFLEEVELLQFFMHREEKERSPYHRNLVKLKERYSNPLVSKVVDLDEVGTVDKQTIFDWAWREYKSPKDEPSQRNFSLVHPSLESDPLFDCIDGIKVTKLALHCVHKDPRKRPSMKQVYKHLLKLNVAQSDAAIKGNGSKLSGDASKLESDELSGRRSLQEETSLQLFSYDDLRIFTNDFSDENRIYDFQFGKLFRGRIQDREVVVKIWQPGGIYRSGHDNNTLRLRDEIILLQLPELICNPNLVELIGYCREGEHIGVVYDLKALDTVFNLIRKGSLTWLQIVKIGIGFASLLKFLHTDNPPLQSYIVCNISPSHIILDQDFFPMLIDYGELSGGILPDSRPVKGMGPRGCFGYMRDAYAYTQKNDVYAYGSVLLSLLCKRVFTEEDRLSYRPYVAEWAESQFKASLFSSLVDQSFVKEEGYFHRDAIEVTKLAIQCVAYYSEDRPTMEQVVKRLLKLKVVHAHADELGIDKLL